MTFFGVSREDYFLISETGWCSSLGKNQLILKEDNQDPPTGHTVTTQSFYISFYFPLYLTFWETVVNLSPSFPVLSSLEYLFWLTSADDIIFRNLIFMAGWQDYLTCNIESSIIFPM